MHTIHLSGNTSGVSKSSSDWLNYTGFPGDVSVAFFNVLPGNKDAVALNSPPHALVFTTIDGHLSGSTKRWIFYVKNVKFKSYNLSICQRVLHTGLLLWWHFHAPKRDAAQNETWLVALPVIHMASWAGLGYSKQPKFPDLQPLVCLSTRD